MASSSKKTEIPTLEALPNEPTFNNKRYEDTGRGSVSKKAMETALEAFNNYGAHTWANQAINDEILKNYLNRGAFSYDLNGDALYQQYKDKYIQQGKMAMQDTMGQAAALTGGYGNSYAQSVGQQAYQNSLDNLNDIIPELYQMAYDRYNQEGQDMLNKLGVLSDDYNRSYGEWETGYNMAKDKYGIASDSFYNAANLYNTDRDTANDLAQQGYQNRFDAVTINNDNKWKAYEAEEDARRWEAENNTNTSSGSTYGSNKGYVTTIAPGTGTTTTVNPDGSIKSIKSNNDNDNKSGSYYTTSLTDLKQMKAAGKSNKEAMEYLSDMQKAGYLTTSEYISLYNKYRDNKL